MFGVLLHPAEVLPIANIRNMILVASIVTVSMLGSYAALGYHRSGGHRAVILPLSPDMCDIHAWAGNGLVTGPTDVTSYRKELDPIEFDQLNLLHPEVQHGGYWRPRTCKAVDKVAVIVPFRDRSSHLRILLHNLHRFLQSQLLEYRIFIVEQIANTTFNRGKLMNVGFVEAFPENVSANMEKSTCAVFHDVDLIPEGPGPFYACDSEPKLLGYKQSQFNYKLPYVGYMGGVVSMTEAQVRNINGFSNDYWGWGGEDDDVAWRIKHANFKNPKPEEPIGQHHMIHHKKHAGQKVNECRFQLLKQESRRHTKDGLNSLRYKKLHRKEYPLYTWILVDLLEHESIDELHSQGLCLKSKAKS